MALYAPSSVFYWFGLCLLASIGVSAFLTKNSETRKIRLIDALSFILLCVGVFWWVLWIDFAIIKYAIPLIIWAVFAHLGTDSFKMGVLSRKERLGLFFGGTFFWASVCFGLLTVLGWSIWVCALIFLACFSLFSYGACQILSDNKIKNTSAYLLVLFLAAEFFIVIAWLPFADATLALIFVVCILFVYDFAKYYVSPELIRKRIVTKKFAVYFLFLILALFSTPWY